MAAVRSLRASVKSDSSSDRSDSDSDSESDRDVREAEPMEVEEGELEAEDVSVNRSLKELLPDTSRRYENKAGAFITGIDVNSKEALEKKEKRARRFHFRCEDTVCQRTVFLDKDALSKAIPKLRMEAIHVTGVDDMSTQDVFGYFAEYPPAHIEWINDTSCNVVWLDNDTCIRALINTSRMAEPELVTTATESHEQSQDRQAQGSDDDDEEEGEVDEEEEEEESVKKSRDEEAEPLKKEGSGQVDQRMELSEAERESLLRNDLRPVIKPFRGNKLLLRFATQDDKKELGAARRSRYYMKYGNPNYGGMKGILSNSWKRRYHNRRIQRDVLKSKKPLIGDSMGHTPPYTHRHSADLVNLPEEPIKEEEEDEEDDDDRDEDMDSDDRVVEYKDRGSGSRLARAGLQSRTERSPSPWSESDEMDYDLELKMISTPSPKKSKKMTMYADELETHLKSIRNRIGESGSQTTTKSLSPPKVTDVRQLLEEKRQGQSQQRQRSPVANSGKTDVRQRLGKRRYSPDRRHSPSPVSSQDTPPAREPISSVHRRLGVASQDNRVVYSKSSKDRKTSGLWSRLGSGGSADDDGATRRHDRRVGKRSEGLFSSSSSSSSSGGGRKRRGDGKEEEEEEEDDTTLQKVWGAIIKQKQDRLTHKLKKSRLDNLPSLQIEISRDSSDDSDA
ncbi:nuclear cap-binding protein subunit 3 isoform X2 [Nematolebias whitei]|uniref:nuclear cap-binding protein subunit 3 isoform X2 n=1 Tax=Nematolebias whitei TaxID=451745 RepID=UPI00189BF4F2|nr:nuclear cap-binding protein subunit 3 isoform X2 [Nematolebias whitei]